MSEEALPRRIVFFFSSVVIAIFLVFIMLVLASPDVNSTGSKPYAGTSSGVFLSSISSKVDTFGNKFKNTLSTPEGAAALSATIRRGFSTVGNALVGSMSVVNRGMNSGLLAIFRTTDGISRASHTAISLNALIQPAEYVPVPAINPIASEPTIAAIPAAPLETVTPEPQPTPVVKTAIAITTLPAIQTANSYVWGNCTWWASNRRAQINNPVPNSWGNAAWWARSAARDGYGIDHTPSPGAIMQTANSAGGLGHVAFVESVDPDGTWHISEMNVVGLGRVSLSAKPPSEAANYNFIHNRI